MPKRPQTEKPYSNRQQHRFMETTAQNTNESPEPNRGPGRPTKYSEQTITTLCEALSRGSRISAACAAARIGVQTLSDWKKEHPALQARIDAAQEEMRQKALQTIKNAVDGGDWRAAAKALELVFPEYRQNSKVEVCATANAAIAPTQVFLTPEQIRELQARHKQLLEETRK